MNARKSALVIGGTGAIGHRIVSQLIARQYSVYSTFCNESDTTDGRAHWIQYDALSDSHSALLELSVTIPTPLSAVFFCIGIPSSKLPVIDTDPHEFARLLQVNCISFVKVYSMFAAKCRSSDARVLALSSSTTRSIGPRNGAYSASKAALESVVVTLAKEEAAYGVRVNALAPSLVASPLADHLLILKGIENRQEYVQQQAWGRLLSLSEVAESAVSLATDSCWSYMTGQVIRLSAER